MKTNSGKMVNGSLEYARPTKDGTNGGFWDKINRYAIYKKSDISAKMNPDGSILITHPDTYDFSYMDPEKEDKWWNKGIAKANNIALSHQEKGQISKYSLTSLMSLTPEEIQELLERSKRRKNSK